MKRTQLYLEEEVWKLLGILARQSQSSVSDLVRQALRDKYLNHAANRAGVFQSVVGLWKNRKDIKDSSAYVRYLRKGTRLKRTLV